MTSRTLRSAENSPAPRAGMVQTVTGLVEPDRLGIPPVPAPLLLDVGRDFEAPGAAGARTRVAAPQAFARPQTHPDHKGLSGAYRVPSTSSSSSMQFASPA